MAISAKDRDSVLQSRKDPLPQGDVGIGLEASSFHSPAKKEDSLVISEDTYVVLLPPTSPLPFSDPRQATRFLPPLFAPPSAEERAFIQHQLFEGIKEVSQAIASMEARQESRGWFYKVSDFFFGPDEPDLYIAQSKYYLHQAKEFWIAGYFGESHRLLLKSAEAFEEYQKRYGSYLLESSHHESKIAFGIKCAFAVGALILTAVVFSPLLPYLPFALELATTGGVLGLAKAGTGLIAGGIAVYSSASLVGQALTPGEKILDPIQMQRDMHIGAFIGLAPFAGAAGAGLAAGTEGTTRFLLQNLPMAGTAGILSVVRTYAKEQDPKKAALSGGIVFGAAYAFPLMALGMNRLFPLTKGNEGELGKIISLQDHRAKLLAESGEEGIPASPFAPFPARIGAPDRSNVVPLFGVRPARVMEGGALRTIPNRAVAYNPQRPYLGGSAVPQLQVNPNQEPTPEPSPTPISLSSEFSTPNFASILFDPRDLMNIPETPWFIPSFVTAEDRYLSFFEQENQKLFRRLGEIGVNWNSPNAIRMSTGGPDSADAAKEVGNGEEAEEPAQVLTQDLVLEENKTGPQELLVQVEAEFQRACDFYTALIPSLPDEVSQAYWKEIFLIRHHIEYWRSEIAHLPSETVGVQARYRENIRIGERLLLDRVLSFLAVLYAEPIDEGNLAQIGLRSPFGIRPRTQKELPSGKPESPSLPAGVVPTLVNRDIGYGKVLVLRPHQEEGWVRTKGWLSSQWVKLQAGETVPPEFLQATIVMPVGGGKTRTMVADFAATLDMGIFQLGDKLILLDHTDQIHGQNLEAVQLLRAYFRRKMGRELKVTDYKAEEKNVKGDVVLVSIPTVNTEESRYQLARELKAALGVTGKIAMVAVDEVHHLELGREKSKESWIELLEVLRQVSPNFFRLGFTATPTGKEGRVIFRLREQELMQASVTPRTYLVRVDGVDLSQLKVGKDADDFSSKALVSVLLDHPERNQRIYQALETDGIRKLNQSPSGREQLEATIGFGGDLDHAAMQARDYVKYFSQGKGALHDRRFILLGEEEGKIKAKELENALKAYRDGKVDGVIAVVSGKSGAQKGKVLEAADKGEIEAAFTVDALVEGADLYMFTHQIGGRPTFSRIKKGQERGRTNRRNPNEVSNEGVLLRDPPRILFDVIDHYSSYDRALVHYGDVMGITGHARVPYGRLFDALAGQEVDQVDQDGTRVVRLDPKAILDERTKPKPIPKPPAVSPWTPLIELLRGILETQYGSDMQALAQDLGETEEYIEQLLRGEGWTNNQWFLRRLSTLLYQRRDLFLDELNSALGLRSENIEPADLQLLREAVALYETWEGKTPPGQTVLIQGNKAGIEAQILPETLQKLQRGAIGERVWAELWRGMAIYFQNNLWNRNQPDERRERANQAYVNLRDHLFNRWGWSLESNGTREYLLYRAREGTLLRFNTILPREVAKLGLPVQDAERSLSQWLREGKVEFNNKMTPTKFYPQVRVLLGLTGTGETQALSLIEAAIFEAHPNWPRQATNAREQLLLVARKRAAQKFGGELPWDIGENLPKQKPHSTLTRWIKGEEIKLGIGLSPLEFYSQVRELLKVTGMAEKEIDILIERAVFEDHPDWPTQANNAQERLMLAVRRVLAIKFGGVLPREIAGLPKQGPKSALTRWFNRETDLRSAPTDQIYSSLTYEGCFSPEIARRLIDEALAEGK